MSQPLEEALMSTVAEPARSWLSRALSKAETGAWQAPFALMTRKLPRQAVEGLAIEPAWLADGATLAELGRVAVLIRMATAGAVGSGALQGHGGTPGETLESAGDSSVMTTLSECYRLGDNAEKRAVLRTLPLLLGGLPPDPLVELAIAACRTNVTTVFEAICCSNPLPAARFPQHNFNQMVLKAVFVEVALDRIIGLQDRLNDDLARMATDFADERRAAGRTVPADIALVT